MTDKPDDDESVFSTFLVGPSRDNRRPDITPGVTVHVLKAPATCTDCVHHYPKNEDWTCELGKKPDTCGSKLLPPMRLPAPVPVTVPEFVREAVARLDNPEQARLLLKMIRTYGTLGNRMSKSVLFRLVDRVKANGKELPESSSLQDPSLGEPFQVIDAPDETRLGCDDARRILSLEVECCSSCHDDWESPYGEPTQVDTREGTFYVCHSVAEAIRAKWQRD